MERCSGGACVVWSAVEEGEWGCYLCGEEEVVGRRREEVAEGKVGGGHATISVDCCT